MDYIKVSKFMSLVLRHKPETINIKLNEHGWVPINEFIEKINKYGHFNINIDILNKIVSENDKQRFKIQDGKIRASQGHSIHINLELENKEPPEILYHGTAIRFLNSIRESGLEHMSREYVHLSLSRATCSSLKM